MARGKFHGKKFALTLLFDLVFILTVLHFLRHLSILSIAGQVCILFSLLIYSPRMSSVALGCEMSFLDLFLSFMVDSFGHICLPKHLLIFVANVNWTCRVDGCKCRLEASLESIVSKMLIE